MAREPFVWGGAGQRMSPKQVDERRKIAQALLEKASDTSPVGHWTAALNRGLQGVIGSWDRASAENAEAAGRAGLEAKRAGQANAATFGGADPVAAALSGGSGLGNYAVPAGGDVATSLFPASLIETESGGNWNALNNEGYGGRLQFGAARLADAANAGIIPAGIDGAAFSRLPPEQQMAVENWHFQDIEDQARRMGLDQYVGQTVAGVPIDMNAIKGMAHLGGIGGAAKFLQSGGQYNPADSNGTSLAAYGRRHGGSAAPAQGGGMSNIAALLADEWLPDSERAVLQAQYESQLKQQDPMYQAQLQGAQLVNQKAAQPAVSDYDQRAAAADQFGLQGDARQAFVLTGNIPGMGGAGTPAQIQELQWRAQEAGLQPGTPDYQKFILNGGRAESNRPAAVEAAHQLALLSGFQEGTPEYQDFIRTRGAAEVAGAQVTGKAAAEQAIAAPAEINAADDTLGYIQELRDHPGREWGTGMSAWTGMIPGTPAYDFSTRVGQLEGGAFLTAIGEMQGMGALSNQEGQTAKAAVARLSRAQSEPEFLAALDDYQRIIERGKERAQKKMKVTDAVPKVGDESDDDFLRRMGLQ